ncbi:MAG: indole-3-glycerol phosphate synthase TrpC [Legionellales bacterium]|nr:indole-3-glycerol phosphate synthase TrpC [Legionellales bacterium]
MPHILDQIIQHKRQQVAQQQRQISQATLLHECQTLPSPRDFVQALQQQYRQQQTAVIAEIKRASPSQGIIRDPFDPVAIAQSYQQGGATCLSVLTDEKFFHGETKHLQMAHAACELPILRKDFIIDPYQVYQTRAMGADAILLIVAALSDSQLLDLSQLALQLNLAVLVESHDLTELQRALQLPTPLMGINNRNLQTFHTDLNTTLHLAQHIPADRLIISESGIHQPKDITQLQQHGVYTYLIGESLMRATDPGAALQGLIGLQ